MMGDEETMNSIRVAPTETGSSSSSSSSPPGGADPIQPSLWTQLVRKLHPSICLSSIDPDLPLDVAVPLILADLDSGKKLRAQALQKLYVLTDQQHKEYREELVTKYKIFDTLVKILPDPASRRMALLTLNNLVIPWANKEKLLRHTELMKQVYAILREMPPADTYLACLCLRNLSFDPAAQTRLGEDLVLQLCLQKLFVTYAPVVMQSSNPKNALKSAEGLALKWSAGILRQLSVSRLHEDLVLILLKLISYCSKHVPLHDWTENSLPDSSLVILLMISKSDCNMLRQLQAQEYLHALIGKGGIHDTRASWIQCCLEGL